MQDKQRSHIENAAFQSNNILIALKSCHFELLSVRDYFPEDIPTKADATFYMNTTDTPITIMDRDGVVRVTQVQRATEVNVFKENDIRKLHPNCLIIVRTFAHDLSAMNPKIARSSDIATAFSEVEILKGMHNRQSDFKRHYTNVNLAYCEALKSHQYLERGTKSEIGMSVIEDNGTFITAIYAIVKGQDIPEKDGCYVEAHDVVMRRERYDTSPSDPYAGIVINHRQLIHPFSLFGTAYNAEGGHSVRDPNVYFRSIRAIRKEKYTAINRIFIACFDGVRNVNIDLPEKDEFDGVYVTEKDIDGLIRETHYSFESAKELGIYELESEADSKYRLFAEKFTSDEITRENARKAALAADEAKELARKEQDRKNEAQRKSDVVKYVAQVFGALAAFVTAAVTIVKLFAPSKFSFHW